MFLKLTNDSDEKVLINMDLVEAVFYTEGETRVYSAEFYEGQEAYWTVQESMDEIKDMLESHYHRQSQPACGD